MSIPQFAGESRRRHPSASSQPRERFAHPSEKAFAQLLNLYRIDWSYEPLEFPIAWNDAGEPVRAFRPDFYLREHKLFIELTVLEQRLVTKKNQPTIPRSRSRAPPDPVVSPRLSRAAPRPVAVADRAPAGGTAITLKVKRDRVIPVCKALLDELPVTDIDIQEVPIEEVIRQIFAR